MSSVLGVVPQQQLAPLLSEEAVALQFAAQHASSIRYVDLWKCWFVYTGKRWVKDTTREVYSRAREISREAAAVANDPTKQRSMASSHFRHAVVSLASDDRALAAGIEQWDSDPWLLNTPDGVVDLRTGTKRPHCPQDYLTKMTAVGPNGDCPKWLAFLKEVTGEDEELVSYLQSIFGYCLTGLTAEHALFFMHGLGANGKSVLVTTLAGLLGEYHRTAAIETFTASNTDRHPTELAMLRGARLVTAVETEEGRGWAESRIKALTGGDKITARFMRQDFFEYVPQFKLLIAGNHKPSLRSVDEAIKRRFKLIPFDVTIPADRRNPNLVEELKSEWPGILRWAIDGCLAWQRSGRLTPPERVSNATAAYLEAEDAFEKWKDDCCLRDATAWAPTGQLYASWKQWAEQAGEFVGSERRFSQTLAGHGYKPVRRDKRGFAGLRLTGREPM